MQAWTLPAMTFIAGLGLGIIAAGCRFKGTLALYEHFIADRLDLQNSPLVPDRASAKRYLGDEAHHSVIG